MVVNRPAKISWLAVRFSRLPFRALWFSFNLPGRSGFYEPALSKMRWFGLCAKQSQVRPLWRGLACGICLYRSRAGGGGQTHQRACQIARAEVSVICTDLF